MTNATAISDEAAARNCWWAQQFPISELLQRATAITNEMLQGTGDTTNATAIMTRNATAIICNSKSAGDAKQALPSNKCYRYFR
jgi:hypothetical protein